MKSCNHRKSYEMIRNHKKSYEIKGNHEQTDMCYLIWPSVGDPWVVPDSAMVLGLSSDDPCRFSNASCVVLERFLCDLGVAMGRRVEHGQAGMCYLIWPLLGDPWVDPDSAMVLGLSSDDPRRFSNASCVVLGRFLGGLGVAMGPRVELGLSVGVGYTWRDNLGIR